MSVNDVCDELAATLEPDETLRDDSCAKPTQYEADVLYLWPSRERRTRAGTRDATGAEMDVDTAVRVAWAADRGGEADDRDREVSDEIAARLAQYESNLRAHQTGTHYYDAHIAEVDYEAILGPDVRGFIATIQGRSLRTV